MNGKGRSAITGPERQGTWSDEDTWFEDTPLYGPTTVTLTECALGERCGRLERIDDNLEHCVYELVYRSEDEDGFTFKTSKGTFVCAYTDWSDGVVHLTPGTDGTIEVAVGDVETNTLRRAED